MDNEEGLRLARLAQQERLQEAAKDAQAQRKSKPKKPSKLRPRTALLPRWLSSPLFLRIYGLTINLASVCSQQTKTIRCRHGQIVAAVAEGATFASSVRQPATLAGEVNSTTTRAP